MEHEEESFAAAPDGHHTRITIESRTMCAVTYFVGGHTDVFQHVQDCALRYVKAGLLPQAAAKPIVVGLVVRVDNGEPFKISVRPLVHVTAEFRFLEGSANNPFPKNYL